MPKLRALIRVSFRFFAAVLGLGLMGYLIFRAGPGVIWKQLQAIRWGLALIIAMGGLSQFVKAWAWRQTFTCDISRLSWLRSVGTQLASDAMGQFGFAGKLLGEGMRISLLGSTVPLPNALSAAAIDGGLHAFSAAIITVSGIVAGLLLAPVPPEWRFYALLLAAVLTAVVILAAIALARRWPLMGNAARTLGRLPRLQHWISGKQSIIDSAENNLLTFRHEAPLAFWSSLTLNLLWHALAILEVFLVLRFMGSRIPVGGAFVVEGLTKVINFVGVFNPGNLGTYEAGSMLVAKLFGVTGTAGLTLALCRRVRTVFWAGVGAMCLTLMSRAEFTDQNRGKGSDGGVLTPQPLPL